MGQANASPTQHEQSQHSEVVLGAGGSQIASQGSVATGPDGALSQTVTLDNGVVVEVTLLQQQGTIRLSASNGENYSFLVSDLQANGAADPLRSSLTNACDVATGIAGIAHSALWGAALGGPAGIAAGPAVGAFWWGISQGC